MSKHIFLFDNELHWLSTLVDITKDSELVKFIVKLDQTYQGIESYLELSEMPGVLLTNALIKTDQAHIRFQYKTVIKTLESMPFFKMCALSKEASNNEYVWNPTDESLKSFCLKHTDKEVIYFEDPNYKKTVQFFQQQLNELMSIN